MSNANSTQVAGTHYQSAYQHWDWSNDINMKPLPYQVSKYVSRWKKKNGEQDLEKALHFIDKYIELVKQDILNIQGRTREYIVLNKVEDPHEMSILHGLSLLTIPDVDLLEVTRDAIVLLLKDVRNKRTPENK